MKEVSDLTTQQPKKGRKRTIMKKLNYIAETTEEKYAVMNIVRRFGGTCEPSSCEGGYYLNIRLPEENIADANDALSEMWDCKEYAE